MEQYKPRHVNNLPTNSLRNEQYLIKYDLNKWFQAQLQCWRNLRGFNAYDQIS